MNGLRDYKFNYEMIILCIEASCVRVMDISTLVVR